jgi:hypothetical protein
MATKEQLGQELDRWQIIARDLILELMNDKPERLPENYWVKAIWEELAEMPEMRINK